MNVNDMLLQMVYAAGQIAQNTLPQTDYTELHTSEGKDFQTLLSEKRSAVEQKDLDTVQKDSTASQQQPAAQGDAAVQQAAAVVQQAAVQPAVMLTGAEPQSTVGIVPAVEAPVVPAAQTVQTAVPAEVLQTAEAAPQAAAVAQEPLTAAVPVNAQPEQTGTVQPEGEAEASITVETPQTAQVRQAQPGQEQEAGQQPAADSEQQTTRESGVEVLQAQSSDVGQPVFRETDTMFQRVGDAPMLDTQSGELEGKLTSMMTASLEDGGQRLEIKLSPEYLGNVVVEMNRTPEGVLQVVLHTENSQAAKLLSQHSDTLSMMLQNSQQGEVRIEIRQPDQNERPWQQPDQNGGQNGQEGRQQQERRRQPSDPERFLQQLRLGLVPAEF